jgi:broad specificity phosphatase PhoE
MSVIYLLRHGQTEWNVAGRIQGASDSPLTATGIAQAEAIGALLKRLIVEPAELALVSSPQGRAWRTAEIVGTPLGLTPRPEPRLVEVKTGSWDGMTLAEIDVAYPGALEGATFGRSFRSPDGESYERARARVADWLATLTAPTIAVSHGLTGRMLRGVYAGLSQDDTLRQPEPQDGVYRLAGGRVEFIQAEPVGSAIRR